MLEDHLRQSAKSECTKLNRTMEKNGTGYKDTVLFLLEKNKASYKVKNRFSKLVSPQIEEEFVRTVKEEIDV